MGNADGPILDLVVAGAAGTQNLADRLVNDMAVVRMNGVEVGDVVWLGVGRQTEQFIAAVGPTNHADGRVIVEDTNVGRFQGEANSFFRDVQALLTFAQPFLLLHHFADIGAINRKTIAAGINPRINPATPRLVKNFELIGLLRFHGAMTALIEFSADRFGKNFPDHPADDFLLPLSRQFENALVHVDVAPVAIEDGKSVADAGEGGFALLEQIADGAQRSALLPTSLHHRSQCGHQCDYSERRWKD